MDMRSDNMEIMRLYKLLGVIKPQIDGALVKAIVKHGYQEDNTLDRQYVILLEEIGEIAKAILEDNKEELKIEILQSMAMLLKLYWLVTKEVDDGNSNSI
jgi:hypothetical protein